jgi:hypothetical protein
MRSKSFGTASELMAARLEVQVCAPSKSRPLYRAYRCSPGLHHGPLRVGGLSPFAHYPIYLCLSVGARSRQDNLRKNARPLGAAAIHAIKADGCMAPTATLPAGISAMEDPWLPVIWECETTNSQHLSAALKTWDCLVSLSNRSLSRSAHKSSRKGGQAKRRLTKYL